MSATTVFEWSGAFLRSLGAILLATHSKASRYGQIAILGAQIAMSGFV